MPYRKVTTEGVTPLVPLHQVRNDPAVTGTLDSKLYST